MSITKHLLVDLSSLSLKSLESSSFNYFITHNVKKLPKWKKIAETVPDL